MMNRFPGNKRFAFSIFDDTDNSTLDNVQPVYRLLDELGLRTTKSVWVLPNVPGAKYAAATLHDRDYLQWILHLQEQGFEIALHNVRNSDSPRPVIEQGFTDYERRLGGSPRVHANHSGNRDNIYWGDARLSRAAMRLCYNVATRFRRRGRFFGHVPGSDYFWGDLCRERIDYVRNLVFDEINLDNVNPSMPYHDPARPYVKRWFSSCEGAHVNEFCHTLRESNQDKLEAEGGVCIMYTHFADGFSNGRLEPRFEMLMRRLARKDGWFVPVSTLLDHLAAQRAAAAIPPQELAGMEARWLVSKMRHGAS
jgi:hypothetical protein